jgi:hypothetical protein
MLSMYTLLVLINMPMYFIDKFLAFLDFSAARDSVP